MNTIIKYGAIAAVLAAVFYFIDSSDKNYADDDIDLNIVLDATLDTLHIYQDTLNTQDQDQLDADRAFLGFSDALEMAYNNVQPPLYALPIAVSPQADSSLLAYEDKNANREQDQDEASLFLIEIDGENSRIIASSGNGAVNEHHFSGSGLLAGYLIGSMLTRQRGAGVSSKQLASKKPVTAKAAAKSRAGSGSHSKGK